MKDHNPIWPRNIILTASTNWVYSGMLTVQLLLINNSCHITTKIMSTYTSTEVQAFNTKSTTRYCLRYRLIVEHVIKIIDKQWIVWYKSKFGSQNFGYQIWWLFLLYMYCFQKYVQYQSNNNVIKHYNAVIPHDWDMRFEKFRGLPTVVAFWEN